MRKLFFDKVAGAAWNFVKKETPTQAISCELCEIFKNTYFMEHLLTTASTYYIVLVRFFIKIHVKVCCIQI